MAKEIKQWITVNHIHIPIFEGETVKDAVDRMKKGARKGKDTRPISKESYEKKAKAADKAYKSIGEHSERLLKANKKIKEGDNSPEAKKEFMNAERTLKEAGQRFQKRSAEHQEAVKHPKYTSIKVKKGEKKELQKNIDHVQSKSSHTLANDLKSKGFELDSADRHTIENSRTFNDEKVILFDKNNNEYEGTFNKYSDGGAEIVNITKKKQSWQDKDAEIKDKQIANHEKQKAERNGEPKKSHVWTAEDKERWEVREAYARGDISPEEAKAYGFTDEQLKAIKDMGRREALQRVADGRNKSAYIDPMGNFNTAKSRSKYEINHNEDFRNLTPERARQELSKMREESKLREGSTHSPIDPSVHEQISGLGKRMSTQAKFKNADGHDIEVYVERVNRRDYWGRNLGTHTYTVNVWDKTKDEKLWYDYGVDNIGRVKDDVYRVTGISKPGRSKKRK